METIIDAHDISKTYYPGSVPVKALMACICISSVAPLRRWLDLPDPEKQR